MADIYSGKKRSKIMSRISGKETKPEILIRQFLYSQGFRFRKNDKRYPGQPDIVLPKYKTVIFVHGCFWHGHSCKAGKLPETRKEFWTKKINDTKLRDQRNTEALREAGWNVIVIWNCEINTISKHEKTLNSLAFKIKQSHLHIKEAKHLHYYKIWLKFNDGTSGEVDLKDELYGEVFEPLRELKAFKNFKVDPEIETIVWDNGAHFAPEFLHKKLKVTA